MAKKENREDVYLRPSQKIFVAAYAKFNNESKSSVIQQGVVKLIESTPRGIREQILMAYKEGK